MINNTNVENTHITNGVLATVYPITFQGAVSQGGTPHLKVVLKLPIGSIRELVYNVDYVLAEVDAVGTEAAIGIKLLSESAAESGNILIITRDTPFTQEKDFQVGRIDPEQLESAEDLAVLRDQELRHQFEVSQEIPEDHEQRIRAAEERLDEIEEKIPAQATAENQLADKDFVNSSIATSTATFRGTYSSLAELEAVTADANDYGFVESTDEVGNTLYSRYKYNGTAWTFEYNLNNSSFTAAQWAAINSGITADMVATYHNTTGRNVGDVFFTMRIDSGLNGAVMCDGTQYNTTDFTGAQAIGALLQAGKVPYVSLAQYTSLLSTNGSVGVFGWDGVGTTAFRVPSLNDIFIETGTAAQIGDYIKPGIPNITGTWQSSSESANVSGAVKLKSTYGTRGWDGTGGIGRTYEIDASSTSGVYGTSNTVQPKAVRYRAMVQLTVAATDEALETCTSVLADVAGLKDGNNFTATGKKNIADLLTPDYTAGIDISSSVTGAGYTALKDGIIYYYTMPATSAIDVTVNGSYVARKGGTSGAYAISGSAIVKQGDIFLMSLMSGGSVYFYPFKGA